MSWEVSPFFFNCWWEDIPRARNFVSVPSIPGFCRESMRPIKRVVLIHLCDLTRTTVKAIATALTESLKKHNIDIANWMNECVFIYRTYHMVSRGGLQFYSSEIGRQLVEAPLAAAISPCLISPTHPTHAWNVQLQRSGLWHDIIHEFKQKRCSSRNHQMCTRRWLSRICHACEIRPIQTMMDSCRELYSFSTFLQKGNAFWISLLTSWEKVRPKTEVEKLVQNKMDWTSLDVWNNLRFIRICSHYPRWNMRSLGGWALWMSRRGVMGLGCQYSNISKWTETHNEKLWAHFLFCVPDGHAGTNETTC